MRKRKLGESGFEVAPLAFGCNVFGWTVDEPTAFALLDAFTSSGCSLIDTADSYSRWVAGNTGGESETMIGNWLKRGGNRGSIVIATKVGSQMGHNRKGLSKKHILRAAEDSLRRLRTDAIDLYQSHYDDPDVSLEETLEAYAQLIKEGKVKAIGASNYSAERLTQSLETAERLGLPAYRSLQPKYNLYDRAGYEYLLEPLCREKGLGVITYSSLASGFLTGKYRSGKDLSKSIRGQGIGLYLNGRGFRILDALDRVAERYHTAPASVALAWILVQPGITAPIASATSVEQLNDLIAATALELDQTSLDLLNQASASL